FSTKDVINEIDSQRITIWFFRLRRDDLCDRTTLFLACNQMHSRTSLTQFSIDLILKLRDSLIGVPARCPRCRQKSCILLQRNTFHGERKMRLPVHSRLALVHIDRSLEGGASTVAWQLTWCLHRIEQVIVDGVQLLQTRQRRQLLGTVSQ